MILRGIAVAAGCLLAACTAEQPEHPQVRLPANRQAPTELAVTAPAYAATASATVSSLQNDPSQRQAQVALTPYSLLRLYARPVSGGWAFSSRYHYNEWRKVARLRGTYPRTLKGPRGETLALTVKHLAPKLVILIDDLGNARWALKRLAALGYPVNGAVLPFTPFVDQAGKAIRNTGGDVILHVPLEPLGYPQDAPGPGALFVTMATERRLAAALAAWHAVPGRIGLNNHMGSRFTSDETAMSDLAAAVRPFSPLFIDSRTVPGNLAMRQMAAHGIPSLGRTHFLDEDPTFLAVGKQLNKAILYARRNGVAIAIGHPHQATIKVLEKAGPHLRKAGITVVNLRNLFNYLPPP